MKITTNRNGAKYEIALEGRLDTTTAPELEKALRDGLADMNTLTIDLDQLEYISSAGLRVLLSIHKTLSEKGGLKLTRVNEMVKEVFDVTGFTDILDIE